MTPETMSTDTVSSDTTTSETETPKASTRRALHAYVSDEAHEAWHDFAAESGVTVSGLLEALTTHLQPQAEAQTLQQVWEESIKSARAVDAKRRRRR